MLPPHEPVRIGKCLLLLENFDFVWTMGPGLRRDDDQGEYVNFDSFPGSQDEAFS
jgi:hypothetical protein